MLQSIFTVLSNESLTRDIYRTVLSGDTSKITAPGQFVNIKIDGLFLRRPISVCDCNPGELVTVYRNVGEGTNKMSLSVPGDRFDILTGLGNGYDTSKSGDKPLLIGGGAGVPPMYMLCKTLIKQGKSPSVVLGFNTADDVFMENDFLSTGANVYIATADGGKGEKGFVTDIIKNLSYSYFYTCGPMPMFKAIDTIATTSGQFSFEERMGCGFGACMGCSCKTKYGNKRICRDGPVLEREEIIW